ncbi:MAG: nucleotidyltransferase family protein, partial [Desulfofustis sp.]|nr:nucleotidyltransferase family protein [Desulfofustis sp.]
VVLQDLLTTLVAEGLSPLVIKGAALCHTLYPDPALRPMRDIDLLLAPEEAVRAQQVALSAGFDRHGTPTPDDHYHLPPLVKTVEGMKVCIEIHRALYPDCPPYYPRTDFERLLAGSAPFACGDLCCATLGAEEMLSHLYHHGFRMPLSYEPYKLINAADLIGFVEQQAEALDWSRLRREQPQLCTALSMMQHLTPWDPQRVPPGIIDPREASRRRRPLPYRGWPQRKIRQLKRDKLSLAAILKETFLPPLWWVKLYYGTRSRWQMLCCLGYLHPRHIFWWARLYYALPVGGAPEDGGSPGRWQRLRNLVKKMVS